MQTMTEEGADPPTMKNAGRLNYEHGSEALNLTIVALVLGLIATGAMLQALMTNHGRAARGLALNALAGGAALAILTGISAASGLPMTWEYVSTFVLPTTLVWLVLAVMAFAVGSVVQPPGKVKRRA
jgi:hypothetical protein